MIHQVMLSGNLKRGVPILIEKEDVQRLLDHTDACQYTGLTLYADGNFITIYEGKSGLIEASRLAYANTPRYDNITTLISRRLEKRNFSGFDIGLRGQDSSEDVKTKDECFVINPETLNEVLPNTVPLEFRTLLKTFGRVNNLNLV